MSSSDAEFSKWRAFFWPIHRHECRKLIPMMIILFLICFDYSVVRNAKDVVVVTAEASGAEVIPFIKVWVLLPMAVLLTLIFTKLSNRFSQETVFYLMTSGFLLFFTLFALLFYPFSDYFHPHALANQLAAQLPAGFKGLIAMGRNWTFTLFYVAAELWGSIILGVLFWGFANEITKITEARRFYAMLSVIGSFAGVIAGLVANWVIDETSWALTLSTQLFLIITCGLAAMVVFRWMNVHVLGTSRFRNLHRVTHGKTEQKKLSMWESFGYLANSPYLLCIAALVFGYNLVINLIEVVWKDALRNLYPDAVNYSRYMNGVSIAVGVIATSASFFISRWIALFGWTRISLITPVIMLVTGLGFFGFMVFPDAFSLHFLGELSPLAIAVFFGAAQISLSKGAKYSVFDATKEMAFIPLDHESKLKGKAAIDGVGSRLGKSGGSLIHQGLLMLFGSLAASAPYVGLIMVIAITGWIIATKALGKQFVAKITAKGREEIGEHV